MRPNSGFEALTSAGKRDASSPSVSSINRAGWVFLEKNVLSAIATLSIGICNRPMNPLTPMGIFGSSNS